MCSMHKAETNAQFPSVSTVRHQQKEAEAQSMKQQHDLCIIPLVELSLAIRQSSYWLNWGANRVDLMGQSGGVEEQANSRNIVHCYPTPLPFPCSHCILNKPFSRLSSIQR